MQEFPGAHFAYSSQHVQEYFYPVHASPCEPQEKSCFTVSKSNIFSKRMGGRSS